MVAAKPGSGSLNSADPDAPSALEISRTIARQLDHVWDEVLLDDEAERSAGTRGSAHPIVLDMTAPGSDTGGAVTGPTRSLAVAARGASLRLDDYSRFDSSRQHLRRGASRMLAQLREELAQALGGLLSPCSRTAIDSSDSLSPNTNVRDLLDLGVPDPLADRLVGVVDLDAELAQLLGQRRPRRDGPRPPG